MASVTAVHGVASVTAVLAVEWLQLLLAMEWTCQCESEMNTTSSLPKGTLEF